jgi:hypothetical protein
MPVIIRPVQPAPPPAPHDPDQLVDVVPIEFVVNNSILWMEWTPPTDGDTVCRSYRIRHVYTDDEQTMQEHYVAQAKYAMNLLMSKTLNVSRVLLLNTLNIVHRAQVSISCFTQHRLFDELWRAEGVFSTKGVVQTVHTCVAYEQVLNLCNR